MRDFSISAYRQLLETLLSHGYVFMTVEEYFSAGSVPDKVVVLRHDVDLKPQNSCLTARLEHTLGISATYYFRIFSQSNDPDDISMIARLGHEIGYHYEDLTTAQGDKAKAYQSFCDNLDYFRQFYPVRTCCMHGSPHSAFDSRDIWKEYDYKQQGIIAEPYLDTDFSNMFYLTDTGRCWDGYKVSVRDKIAQQVEWQKQGLTYHTTFDIIAAVEAGTLPLRLMMTTHPQRWTDNMREWYKELIVQNMKNIVKRIIVKNH